MRHPVDVLTIGRSGVDLYPLQHRVELREVETFSRSLGGSPTNVAVAAARLGLSSLVVTAVGDDPFGEFVVDALRGYGVDDSGVVVLPGIQTTLTFCAVFPPDDFPLHFVRAEPSPELRLRPEDIDLDAVRTARLLWITGTGLSVEPSRGAHLACLDARAGGLTVLDLDHRPSFWPDRASATDQFRRVLPRVDVAVGNEDECAVATGEDDPDAAALALLDLGVSLAIVKRGPRGLLARTARERIELPAYPCDVVNGLGAGDAFGGALCRGLLDDWPLERTLRHAGAAGSIVASRLACAPAMPTPAEVDLVVEAGRVPAGL
ncbi:5-dehydro-2-deoxygluconokinase [Salana multivorans]|uniref:5-dehydro-2-deoxygluconokinase n=1 Tax=Salana multivorans TaxID=120377 RepID=A0A3N2DA86_9MICO|nr:5-dehydro-2-deoxygluconokinase [Salana multivorans]ROR96709.1 5-dehydro-2-deoxygluconokinase [Salana multivorans]